MRGEAVAPYWPRPSWTFSVLFPCTEAALETVGKKFWRRLECVLSLSSGKTPWMWWHCPAARTKRKKGKFKDARA